MKVSSVVELIQGKLSNSPAISSFSSIAVDLNYVKKGSLFVAKNQDDIQKAIANGAYGVIYKDAAQLLDSEIAWIKVNSLDDSILRLIRYIIITKKISVFALKPLELRIFEKICKDDGVYIFKKDFDALLTDLQNRQINAIASAHADFLSIALSQIPSIAPQEPSFKISQATLFDMQFYYDSCLYHIPLPALFLNEISSVIYLCENYNITFDLAKFSPLLDLMPLFINTSNFELLNYAQGNCAILALEHKDLFESYANYISQNGKWGVFAQFIPESFDINALNLDSSNIIYYQSMLDLLNLICKTHFNFGVILGITNETFLRALEVAKPAETSLFDCL
ncbi:MAG: hypothetical protein E7K04_02660 [Helicobacter sp.]|nr:hypothetical protein [Helicobacter sp.]